jgi:hypothetical protein
MSIVHNNQRRYAISRIAQSDYFTATAPNTGPTFNFQQLLLKDTPGQNFANYSVRVQNNQGYSTGSDFASEQWLTAHDVERQGMDFDVCSETLGRLLFYAFGLVSTSTIQLNNIYAHTFNPMNPTTSVGRQLPAFSYLEQIGAEYDVLYPSCVIDTLSISGDSLNRIMGSATFRGSGKRISPSIPPSTSINFATQVGPSQNLNYFYNTQVGITFNPASGFTGSQLAYTCDYDSFSFTIRNGLNPESGYRAGCGKYQVSGDSTSGAIRSEMLFGQRDIDLTFTVRMNTSSKEYDYLQKQKLLTGSITLTGGQIGATGANHTLVISFDRAAMETAVIGAESDNIVTLQINLKPLVLNTTTNPFKVVDVVLTNGVQSYLT